MDEIPRCRVPRCNAPGIIGGDLCGHHWLEQERAARRLVLPGQPAAPAPTEAEIRELLRQLESQML